MKYQKVLHQFLKQCRQFDFLELLESYDGYDIMVEEIDAHNYHCTFESTDMEDEVHVIIKINDKKEIVFMQCSCDEDTELLPNSSPYCPHIIGSYLSILERFNPTINIFAYVEGHLDTIEWKESVHQTYDTLFGEYDENNPSQVRSLFEHEALDYICMEDIFEDMDRDEIIGFLENITNAFPPLKDILIQAAMLANLIENDNSDEFEEIEALIKKKKDRLS